MVSRRINKKHLLKLCTAPILLCVCSIVVRGQDERAMPVSSPSSHAGATEIAVLSDLIHDLQIQVHSLSSQLSEMRVDQRRSITELQELRRELGLAKSHEAETPRQPLNSYESSPRNELPPESTVTNVSALPEPQSNEQRLGKLEEDQQVMEGKISDQYQTKVESGSKYRLRLSGVVLLNLYENRGAVDNQDFPDIAKPPEVHHSLVSPGTFGGSLRQSQIHLQTFGPDVMGARTSADVTMDFSGGFTGSPNGVAMGLVRLRTGTVRADWTNTSIIAGQDRLFFAPIAPTSLATLAVPALAYAGELWAWTPQVRIEHRFLLSNDSSLSLQGGILDSLSGDLPADVYYRYPNWGEQSGQPAYAARISWTRHMFGQDLVIGSGAYYGRQDWGFSRKVDGWALTTDLTIPMGKRLELTSEFYRGRAVAGLGGAIGESVLLNGAISDPATMFRGLDSMGGWAQLKFKPTSSFEINAALGLDNPYGGELRRFSSNSIYSETYTRNLSPFVNFIYQLRSDILFSTEYRHLNTSVLDSGSHQADHINVSLGYLF
jgi:hypothetical protein